MDRVKSFRNVVFVAKTFQQKTVFESSRNNRASQILLFQDLFSFLIDLGRSLKLKEHPEKSQLDDSAVEL